MAYVISLKTDDYTTAVVSVTGGDDPFSVRIEPSSEGQEIIVPVGYLVLIDQTSVLEED